MHRCFSQAGVDSLGAIELRNAVAAKFSVTLPATALFDYPSPSILANAIAELMIPSFKSAQAVAPRTAAPAGKANTLAVGAIRSRFPTKSEAQHDQARS